MRWCDIEPNPLEWANNGADIPIEVTISPNGHKTCQQRNCGKFSIWADIRPGEQLAPSRFLPSLTGLLEAYLRAGRTLTSESPVFFATAGAGHRFTDRPATCGVVQGMLKRRAAAAALDGEHFTGHSFRRGRMQDDANGGIPAAVTQARALGIGRATYELYTDRSRPVRRIGVAAIVPAPAPSAHEPLLTRVIAAVRHWRTPRAHRSLA